MTYAAHSRLKKFVYVRSLDLFFFQVFLPPAPLLAGAHVSGLPSYHEMYRNSINDSDAFWRTVAAELHFEKTSQKGLEYNFDAKKGKIFCRFMDGARTNISYNCLERNIQRGLGDKIAYIWEGNEPSDSATITYKELHEQVVNFSAVLRAHGVKRGDVVALYLPMITELAVAMLACARIGKYCFCLFFLIIPISRSYALCGLCWIFGRVPCCSRR